MQKRTLMAYIAEASRLGHSVNYEELEDGLVSVSVPVFNRAGLVVAALNASTSSTRAERMSLKGEFLLKLKATAGQLASMLP